MRRTILIAVFVIMLFDLSAFAQITLPDDSATVNDAPIDGFVLVGVAVASLLGIAKLKRK